MATAPNMGKARNLRVIIWEETDHATMITTVNDWLVGRGEEEVLEILWDFQVYGSPATEHIHVMIVYTEE